MNYLPEFLTIAAIHWLALMSPGPDFILVSRNSLVYSRRAGILTALGLALGMSVHVVYSLIGIGLIISQSVVLFNIMKFLGAGYLIYVGYKALRAKAPAPAAGTALPRTELTSWRALRMGLLTNITNPKVTLFFLSVFTLTVNPATPLFIKSLYGLEMALATFAWFSIVTFIFSHHLLRSRVDRIQHYAERVMGALLIAFGVKLVLSGSK